jgi:hypothetical protein
VSSKIHRIRYNQPFDLTPEQKGLLASLSRDTGTPIPALLAKALAELQRRSVSGGTPDREEQVRGSAPPRKNRSDTSPKSSSATFPKTN